MLSLSLKYIHLEGDEYTNQQMLAGIIRIGKGKRWERKEKDQF